MSQRCQAVEFDLNCPEIKIPFHKRNLIPDLTAGRIINRASTKDHLNFDKVLWFGAISIRAEINKSDLFLTFEELIRAFRCKKIALVSVFLLV